jgi:PKD repeat protein
MISTVNRLQSRLRLGAMSMTPCALLGPLSLKIQVSATNVLPGYPVTLVAHIDGAARASRWEFGDGTISSNQLGTSHSWSSGGIYSVILRAYNDSYPQGVTATVSIEVERTVHYVAVDSVTPSAPFTSWATAARSIQDAVDVAGFGALVLVSNGVYETGGRIVTGRLMNRVSITNRIVVQSINGPDVTVIRGYQVPGTTNGDGAVRCVYLSGEGALSGFTLTNGATRADVFPFMPDDERGGGVWGQSDRETVTNCLIIGNAALGGGGVAGVRVVDSVLRQNWARGGGAASEATLLRCVVFNNSAGNGGGTSSGTLNNCLVVGNRATLRGGGTAGGSLVNCTVVANSAGAAGGGGHSAYVYNSILYYNTAPIDANYHDLIPREFKACCTIPLPRTADFSSFTNAPLFVDQAGGNYRLKIGSRCIDAGLNDFAPDGPDLDGQPRIVAGTVDMGAYEFQPPTGLLAWLRQYGLPISSIRLDTDGDQMVNWQEWLAGTDPTDPSSALRFLGIERGPAGVAVSWFGVADRRYDVQRSVNLVDFTSWLDVAGQGEIISITDPSGVDQGAVDYRLRLQE